MMHNSDKYGEICLESFLAETCGARDIRRFSRVRVAFHGNKITALPVIDYAQSVPFPFTG